MDCLNANLVARPLLQANCAATTGKEGIVLPSSYLPWSKKAGDIRKFTTAKQSGLISYDVWWSKEMWLAQHSLWNPLAAGHFYVVKGDCEGQTEESTSLTVILNSL